MCKLKWDISWLLSLGLFLSAATTETMEVTVMDGKKTPSIETDITPEELDVLLKALKNRRIRKETAEFLKLLSCVP